MPAINPTADTTPGLPDLLKYIAEVQSRACRLSGVVSAILFLESEGACAEGQCALIYMAEDLAAEINTALDSVNLPRVTQ
jgi:hypothetical protein